LRILENRVLRKIFGPKKDEVIGNWRKLRGLGLSGFILVPLNATGCDGRRI